MTKVANKERKQKLIAVHPCDDNHQVLTFEGRSDNRYRREPCSECPWRKDSPKGAFPVEAYRHSAKTAHDMSNHIFGCHMSGKEKPATCAGFLLRGAEHNLSVRLMLMRGLIADDLQSNVQLYKDYVQMAVANGVAPDDPALKQCRRNLDQ